MITQTTSMQQQQQQQQQQPAPLSRSSKSFSVSSSSSSTSPDETTILTEDSITMYDLLPILEPYQLKSTLNPKEASMVTYHLIEKLMEHNCDKQTLKIIARYFSSQKYAELVTERIINHYCGYPLCDYYNPSKIKEVQLNAVVSKLKLPKSYNSRFCCKRHYQCSEFYKRQLSPEALFARNQLNLPFDHPKAPESSIILLDDVLVGSENKVQVNGIIDLLREMKVDDPQLETDELIDKFTSIKIVEKEGFHDSSDVYEVNVL
ncbi:hypothetical protein CANARDRAFT_26165 [[Candida] arabinofermentans NRRL YB-2248]|uniref:RNA polymerase II subunit B1 CTD phosphatase RPAP2 homolog n=1 Tax=[Candida] arabinofermentans NRRL YB-2248 TaxID=983967 RepID=A0A1E4T8A9_9ASCO|nr:hypothetical protein CANARDRAFT_26165 [[Candida] arabinofermentans NRRL YB-2248]